MKEIISTSHTWEGQGPTESLAQSNTPVVIHTWELFGSSLSCYLLPCGLHHQKEMWRHHLAGHSEAFWTLLQFMLKGHIWWLLRTLSLYSEDSTTCPYDSICTGGMWWEKSCWQYNRWMDKHRRGGTTVCIPWDISWQGLCIYMISTDKNMVVQKTLVHSSL